MTPLHFFAMKGACQTVAFLIHEKGAKVQARGLYGGTPLWWAAFNRQEEVMNTLVVHGADVNTTNRNGESAVTAAAKVTIFSVHYLLLSDK
jgi:ankyrin repeat protein